MKLRGVVEWRGGGWWSISVIGPYPNQLTRLGTQVDVSGCGSSCLFVAAKLEPVRVTRGEINPGWRVCVSKTHADEAAAR